MRILFMGSPAFAIPTLDAVVKAGHELVGVYTQPPRPAGRGQKMTPSAVHARAEELSLPVFTPISLKLERVEEEMRSLNADIGIVVAYGLILPKNILAVTPRGFLNLHPSMLPRWRGAAPIQRPILAGDTETAICIMQMDEGCDTGDILLYKKYPIAENATTTSMQDELSVAGAELMVHALVGLEHKLLKPIKQDNSLATYAPKLEKEESRIDWKTMDARHIDRMIRALNPWPGVGFACGGEQVKIIEGSPIASDYRKGKLGQVILDATLTGTENPCVFTREGLLRLGVLQRPNRAPTPALECLRGIGVGDGDILG